jgi:hypothetical protein
MVTKRKAPPHAFKPGVSGNLKGKPAGTRSKSTQLLLALMEGDAENITKAVIDAAKGGDLMAAKIILDRLIPPAKERPINVAMPDTKTAEGVSAAQSAILQAAASGDLLPSEAATLSAIVEQKRRAIETQEGWSAWQRLKPGCWRWNP